MEGKLDYPLVSIIIVNWNGHEDTIECLESVYQIDYPNYNVILVDNNSEDFSLDVIRDYCKGKIKVNSKYFHYDPNNKPLKLKELTEENLESKEKENIAKKENELILIKNENNYGFAKGNNIGIRYAFNVLNPDYIMLLNNDTVVDKNFLTELIKCQKKGDNVAAIQSAIYYYSKGHEIQSIGGKFNLFTGNTHIITKCDDNFSEYDFLNGAAMLIKSAALDKVGLIDDQYFLYMEETDWCYQAKKNGFKLKGCKRSKIWHKIYSSSGGKDNPILNYYWTRNMILFYIKNCKFYFPIFIVLFSITKAMQISFFMVKRDFNIIEAILYGLVDGMLNRKGIMKRNY